MSSFKVEKWLADKETFAHLVSKGFDIMKDISSSERKDLLWEVFKGADLEFIDFMCSAGGLELQFDPKNMDWSYKYDWFCPLKLAIETSENGDTSILEFLLEKGCNADLSYYVESPLLFAISKRRHDAFDCLIKNGAKLGEKEFHAIGQSLDTTFITVLLKNDVVLDQYDGKILRSVLTSPNLHREDICENKVQAMVSSLLKAGINPNLKSSGSGYTMGHTLLDNSNHYVADEHIVEKLLSMFLEFGLDLEAEDATGQRLIHLAAKYHICLSFLIQRGVEINPLDANLNTPLLTACDPDLGDSNTSLPIIQLLVENGGDVHHRNNAEQTITDKLLDIRQNNQCILTFLLQNTDIKVPDIDPLDWDRYHGDPGWPLLSCLLHAGSSYQPLKRFVCREEKAGHITGGISLLKQADPWINVKALEQESATEDELTIEELEETDSEQEVPTLRCIVVYQIRHTILTASDNRSIIPQAKKLPLPQKLQHMITLEDFNIEEIAREEVNAVNVHHLMALHLLTGGLPLGMFRTRQTFYDGDSDYDDYW